MTQFALSYLQRMTEAGLPDSIGLDYNSAHDATPRWFGVFPIDDENVLELLQNDDVRQGTKYMSMEEAFTADELKRGEVE